MLSPAVIEILYSHAGNIDPYRETDKRKQPEVNRCHRMLIEHKKYVGSSLRINNFSACQDEQNIKTKKKNPKSYSHPHFLTEILKDHSHRNFALHDTL